MNWKKRKGKVKVMTEHDVWKAAFGRHMDRGNHAADAAEAANAAVQAYRGGPLGTAKQCENELCPSYSGGQAEQAVCRPVPGALQGAAIGTVAKQVAEFHEQAAAAKQPRFKFGDRVLVTLSAGTVPFYDTVARVDPHDHMVFLIGSRRWFASEIVQHASEVSHGQC